MQLIIQVGKLIVENLDSESRQHKENTGAASTSNTDNGLSSLPKQFKAHCTGVGIYSDCSESGLVCPGLASS